MILNYAFQEAAIIEKLPPPWKDFKNYLKHKCKDTTVEDFIIRLRIEDDNKASQKGHVETNHFWSKYCWRGCPQSKIKGVKLLYKKVILLKRNSKETASIMAKLVTRLLIVGLLKRAIKRIKKIWLNLKKKWTISVPFFQNASWLEIQESGG